MNGPNRPRRPKIGEPGEIRAESFSEGDAGEEPRPKPTRIKAPKASKNSRRKKKLRAFKRDREESKEKARERFREREAARGPTTEAELPTFFAALRKLARGEPSALRDEIFKLKDWFTSVRDNRPSGYMNLPKVQAAYLAYHLPLHLPELAWIRKRVPLAKPERPLKFLDYGCGPGTASLGWLESDPDVPVAKWTLADISSRAIENAEILLKTVRPDLNVERRKLPEGWHRVPWRDRFDHILLSHVLNEMGSGPRARDRKAEFVLTLASEALEANGTIWIVEPPLREPSLDLMWLRDTLVAEGFEILAPCPRGVEVCPMAARKLGWCYAQPPRGDAPVDGLRDWDQKIERAMGSRLDRMGFSFIVARVPGDAVRAEERPRPHGVAVTDENAWQRWVCTETGIKQTESRPPYRGFWTPPKAK